MEDQRNGVFSQFCPRGSIFFFWISGLPIFWETPTPSIFSNTCPNASSFFNGGWWLVTILFFAAWVEEFF